MVFILLTLALLAFTNAQTLTQTLLEIFVTPSSQLAATLTGDGRILLAGGVSTGIAGGILDTVTVIEPVSNTQSFGQPLSVARFGIGAASNGNTSIFCGGLTAATTYSDAVDVYVGNEWNTTNLTVARAYPALASIGTKIFVAGGEIGGDLQTDVVEVFDIETGAFGVSETLSVGRSFLATAVLDTRVFFAGGYVEGNVSAVIDIYDDATGNWSIGELSVARQQLAASAVGELVLFAGGADGAFQPFDTVDIWNSTDNTWSNATLSVARWGLQGVVIENLVIFHGGFVATGADGASDVVDIYNYATGAWTVSTLSRPRAQFASVVANQKVFIAGGNTGDLAAVATGLGSLEILNFGPAETPTPPATPTPTPATPTPTPGTPTPVVTPTPTPGFIPVVIVGLGNGRAQLAVTATASGKIIIAGGVGTVITTLFANIEIIGTNNAIIGLQNLSLARYNLAAATAGSKSLFCGGVVLGTLYSARIDIYDDVTGVWSQANLAVPRGLHTASTVGTRIYIGGGQSTLALTRSIEIWNSATEAFETALQLSVARSKLASVTVGTKVYFAGGVIAGGSLSAVIDVLETTTNSLSVLQLTTAREQLAVATIGNYIFFAGGRASTGASAVIEIYDISVNNFIASRTLTVARWALKAITVGTRVLFVGGTTDGVTASAVIDIYESTTDTWSTSSLVTARWDFGAVAYGDKAYYAGGFRSSSEVESSLEIYQEQPEINTPTPTPGSSTPTPTPVPLPVCLANCDAVFNAAKNQFTRATPFRSQCGNWTAYFSCLASCSGNPDSTEVQVAEASCKATQYVNSLCDCGDGADPGSVVVVQIVKDFKDVIQDRFRTNIQSIQDITEELTTFVVSFSIIFNWENTAQNPDGSAVTPDTLASSWAIDLAEFLNADPANFEFEITNFKKRATQTTGFNVNVVYTGQSGVSQLSMSMAFVLVTFLLHVLF